MSTSRYFFLKALWSPGNDVSLLLIAGFMLLDTFDRPESVRRYGPSILQSPKLWIGIACLAALIAIVAGRSRFIARQKWLGDGTWMTSAPLIADSERYYGWPEVFPDRPIRTTEEDAGDWQKYGMGTAFLWGYAASAIAFAGPAQLFSSLHLGGLLFGAFFAIVALVWAWVSYPAEKGKFLVPATAWREAYLTPGKDGLGFEFVVVSKRNREARGGVTLVRMPWSAVNVFDSGSYWRSFGLSVPSTHEDWNVIKMTPAVGQPVLITETYTTDARLYELVTSLSEKFGPAARARYEQEQQRSSASHQVQNHGSVSPGSDVPARFE